MMRLLTQASAAVFSAVLALPALADDFALVLTNRTYADGQESGALSYRQAAEPLLRADFEVYGGDNLLSSAMVRRVQDFRDALRGGRVDRLVIVVSGRMVSGNGQSWVLGRDAGRVDVLNAPQYGVSLHSLNQLLEEYPGQALLVVAPAWRDRDGPGQGLRAGVDALEPGQGVTLLTGQGRDVIPPLNDILAASEPLSRTADNLPGDVRLTGFLPRNRGFEPQGAEPVDQSDSAYWSAVRDLNTEEAYRAYLDRFPGGLFVAEARRMLDRRADEPRRLAEEAEKALNLSSQERREVQRDLSYLGYNTRGVDGIFGPGTRSALSAYQASIGMEQTSYVSRALLRRLSEDVRIKRREQEAEDRRYWERTGASGLRQDLEAYLQRYPNGVYAEAAKRKLAALTGDGDGRSRVAWDAARAENTIPAYREFIARFPNSRYVKEAKARIAELQKPKPNPQVEKDKAEERVVASNPVSRLLIEKGLQKTGHKPGVVDGNFDRNTRRAIRAFQKASNLPVTGFVSQQTMLQLTAASLR